MMKVIGSFILVGCLMVGSADAQNCSNGVCRTPVRTVVRSVAQPVRSCVQGVVVRQPVRSMGRRVLRCRPLRGLFGWRS